MSRIDSTKRSYINVDADFAYDTDLSLEARFLWIILKHHAQNDTGECWPGFSRLSILLGKTEKTVRVAMTELIAKGFVTRQRRGQGRTNLYTVNDLRTVDFTVQETQNGNVVPFRTVDFTALERSKTTDEVITNEILTNEVVLRPKDISDRAKDLIGTDVFTELTKHLIVAGSLDDMDTVAETIIAYPKLPHMLEARRCKSRNGSWHSKTSAQRASLYASWLAGAEEIRLGREAQFGNKGQNKPNIDMSLKPVMPTGIGTEALRAFGIVADQLPTPEYNTYFGDVITSQPNATTIFVQVADKKKRERWVSRYLPMLELACYEVNSSLRPQLAS